MRIRRWSWLVVTGVMVAGCAEKLTYERFSTITPQRSTEAQVVDVLGEPDDRAANQWIYSRFDRDLTVIVTFDDEGVVRQKQWMDPERWAREPVDLDQP